jgi:hypothetical protein
MNELVKTPFVKEVVAVCIDPGARTGPLPSWLKSVPSIMIKGEESPRVGVWAVNNWLMDRKNGITPTITSSKFPNHTTEIAYNSNVDTRPIGQSGGLTQQQIQAPDTGIGFNAYHAAEMGGGGWSDGYSFIGDTNNGASSNIFAPIIHNFATLTGGAAGGDITNTLPQSQHPVSGQNSSAPSFTAEQQRYLDERNRGIPGPIARQ